jgi:hypothetical protein
MSFGIKDYAYRLGISVAPMANGFNLRIRHIVGSVQEYQK